MSDNLRLLKNIFAELEKPLFFGDGLNSGEFHALLQPGQFISTNIQEADSTNDMAIQSFLTDQLIDTQFVFTSLPGSISEQFRIILDGAALPHRALTQPEIDEIGELNTWISSNESTYSVFSVYYYDALTAYSTEANKDTPDPGKLQQLSAKLTKAKNDWNTIGKKIEYETKQARVIYLQSGDPAALWLQYRNNFDFHQKHAPQKGDYLQTFLIPPVSSWNSPGTSWATFERQIDESSSYNYSHQTSWGAGGGGGWGLFSIGGGASGSSSYSHSESDVQTVHIKFDYLRVRIDRPWFRSDIFGYRWWWWKAALGYRLLSDGGNLTATPPIRPLGPLPFIPEYMIVAKNLRIIANFSHNDQTIIRSSISASASAGFGPFSVNGSYSESTSEQTVHARFDGTTISIDNPQIIAFTGTLMPLTPNPDRTLPWPADHAPFDPPSTFSIAATEIRDRESDFSMISLRLADARSRDLQKLDQLAVKRRNGAYRSFFERKDQKK